MVRLAVALAILLGVATSEASKLPTVSADGTVVALPEAASGDICSSESVVFEVVATGARESITTSDQCDEEESGPADPAEVARLTANQARVDQRLAAGGFKPIAVATARGKPPSVKVDAITIKARSTRTKLTIDVLSGGKRLGGASERLEAEVEAQALLMGAFVVPGRAYLLFERSGSGGGPTIMAWTAIAIKGGPAATPPKPPAPGPGDPSK